MAQQRMNARGGFGGFKRSGARRDSVQGQRGLRSLGNRFLRQRMRQRLECGVVFKSKMRSFVRFDEHEDARRVARCFACLRDTGGLLGR